jgi:hypothetical protein
MRVAIAHLYADEVGIAPAKKVSSPEEAQYANALGGNGGGVARARNDRRWQRNVFSLSRAIDAGCARKRA